MTTATIPITVYWRPGCGACERVRRGLRSAGVETTDVNIWQDPDAAAAVRLVARGNETVPMVTIGPTVLVNPSVNSILTEIKHQVPGVSFLATTSMADVERSRRTTLEVVQWSLVVALFGLSLWAEGRGHLALSWALDGVNVAVYFALKALRRLSDRS